MTTPWIVLVLAGPGPHRMDAPLPPRPVVEYDTTAGDALVEPRATRTREVGTGTTVYVNFDGIELGDCNPSSSKRNCHWYNNEAPIEPFSGSMQTRVAILQAMRRHAADFGVRITGVRPSDDEDYTMVVYGGTEEEYGALGSAPSGDCLDQDPNEIAFAHVDGELAGWVNGGATTALHEAAHSWGLEHIEVRGSIMFPSGNNSPTAFRESCDVIVGDTELTPVDASCPSVNTQFCTDGNDQNAIAVLSHLFGPPYVDATAPRIELVEPADGRYFQGPATFDVVLDIEDDLHPQAYSMWAWLGDDPRPETPSTLVTPGFTVKELPLGSWDLHIVLADEAGNESRLDFAVEVGRDPPPDPASGCTIDRPHTVSGVSAVGWLGALALAATVARRRSTG